ncbi:Methyl-CpG-binding domain-containing protein [Actinidia chinensis var. chinensis]|uniref:Methyl-CpG-binding domain-containing protein n=1 Tax=Actinidia chinensis var. chinensis TaxID=1590841 RepID=A0A2R6QDP7_ACTCC|nr:Methyl-CpG-binding domain-containing protein [Actinidia chinensis var. chinensis]
MAENPKSSNSRKRQSGNNSVIVYAAQCGECFKWRVIPTQEEFEDMRSKFIEDPFFCNKKANVSCEDPADIEYDATRVWVIDKPNLPKTPPGFQRELVLRRDFSKMDTYYITPSGTRVRAPSSVASFLEANPECKGVSVSDFSFTPPKVMDDTVPENVKGPGPSSANKKMKALREGDDDV